MRKPEEILDADHELVIEWCAIDVAKDSGMVCTRLPHETKAGRRVSRVWEVAATTRAVIELADHLVAVGIEKVTVESTSDYWRVWFYLLETRGLDVQLVNAREVKNLPGRPKTDKLDAVWLAKLTEKGLLRPSFVPSAQIRQLRDYTRLRVDLTRERTRHWQRLEKLLEDALIKVSSVASKMDTLSVRDMLEALIGGERDPRRLAQLARGRLKSKHDTLVEALSGQFDEHHAELARMLLDQIDGLSTQIEQLTTRAEQLLQSIPAAQAADQQEHSGALWVPNSSSTAVTSSVARRWLSDLIVDRGGATAVSELSAAGGARRGLLARVRGRQISKAPDKGSGNRQQKYATTCVVVPDRDYLMAVWSPLIQDRH